MTGEYIISPIAAWGTAQILKTVIFAIKNKRWEWERLVGDGGMPSCHSSTVTALAITCLLCFGFQSIYFAITAVFALVVMHDASGIRLESGKQAKAINQLREDLQTFLQRPREERLDEILGHTPFQVVVGAIIGTAVAVAVHFI